MRSIVAISSLGSQRVLDDYVVVEPVDEEAETRRVADALAGEEDGERVVAHGLERTGAGSSGDSRGFANNTVGQPFNSSCSRS